MGLGKKFLEVFWDSFRSLFHGRVPLAALLVGTPLMFTVLFGVIYDADVVNDITLTVYDEDQTSLSRTVVQAYADADRFRVVSYVASEEEMKAEILEGRARAALEIPKNFSKEVRLGRGADYMLMVNSANNMFGNAAIAASQEISRSLSVAIGQKLMEGVNLKPSEAMNAAYPVRLGVRITGNPANGYASFMLSGLMLNGLQIGVMVTLAPLLITELQRRQWPSVPVWLLLPAKVIPYILWSLVGFTIAMLICIYVFAVPMVGNWLDAFIDATGFLLFVAGALMLFSACSPSRPLSLQIPMLYIMPGVLYSGLSWPTFDMSSYAYMFGSLLPMSYSGDVLRDIMLNGYSPDLWPNLGCMLLGCLIPGSLGELIFAIRRHFREKHRAAATAGEVS